MLGNAEEIIKFLFEQDREKIWEIKEYKSKRSLNQNAYFYKLIGEIADLGVEYKVITKAGSWFSYEDTRLCQGRDALKRLLADNPELADEITQKIVKAMNGVDEEGAGTPAGE